MTTRRELEAMMKLLMKKAKAKYGSLEMISWKTGVSTKSLHRYEIGEVLPSLEVYAILCECVGGRCYSEKSGSDLLFVPEFNRSDRFVRSIEKVEKWCYHKRGSGVINSWKCTYSVKIKNIMQKMNIIR